MNNSDLPGSDTPSATASPKRSAPGYWLYLLALVLIGLDQWSKLQVVKHLQFGQSVPAFEPWLYWTYVRNTGAAFSMLSGQKWLLSLIALAVSGWIVVYARGLQEKSWLQLSALACILAGALGNVIDRLRLGYVVDFMDLHYAGRNIWPIFNVADICINLGVGLLILYFLTHPEPKEAEARVADTPSVNHD